MSDSSCDSLRTLFLLVLCVSAPQVSSSAVPPVNSAPKGSQLLIVQVPGLRGKVPVPGPAPCPLPPGSAGQRMILQPVRTASGVQYYRKPDGNLVQLVPISQLKPVNPNQSVQKGEGGAFSNRRFIFIQVFKFFTQYGEKTVINRLRYTIYVLHF